MIPDFGPPPEDTGGPSAAPEDAAAPAWGVCEILLVADRARGRTHRFFGGWRVEVVQRSGSPARGTVLFTAPLVPEALAAAGWRYELRSLGEYPGPGCRDRSAFSWRATSAPGTPDPLAAAVKQAHDWLIAHEWEQDPLNPTRYHG